MSHVPAAPTPRGYDVPTVGKPQLPGQLVESERAADRVLYGPHGEVLVRLEDRRQIGFRR